MQTVQERMTSQTSDTSLKTIIETAFNQPDLIAQDELSPILDKTLTGLQQGKLRIAEKIAGTWHVNEWLKKAILLFFREQASQVMSGGFSQFYDKVPLQFAHLSESQLKAQAARIVPPTVVRVGSHIGKNCVLMPCFVNIGAHIDEGCMIDTWATVGSCAQIGKRVHISGGAGVGGVLEPLQANPVIIEDNVFVGARSEIVEGVIVEENSVIGMGVFLSQSTKIYHRHTGEISYGRIPPGSVVVPGSLPDRSGCQLNCAVIVKQVDAKTRAKTSINELLRS